MESTLGFEHIEFLLVENDALQIKESRGRLVAYSAQPLDGPGLTVKAVKAKKTVRISDTRKEPAYVDNKGYDWTGPPTILSELIVPAFIAGEVVAILVGDSTLTDNFNDDDQELLETLAMHVGSALERLRHEEKLEKVARFPSENPNPVLRLSGDGTILYANQASNALLQNWGCKVGGICPKFWQDLVTESLNHQTNKTFDIDLETRAYEIYLAPVLSEGYVNAYGREITERKRLEDGLKQYSLHLEELVNERTRTLRESETRYKLLVENLPEKIFAKDRNSAFISVNESFANDLKIQKEEIVGMTDYDFFSKDLADHYRADDKRVMESGQTEEIEEKYVVGGQEFWVNTIKAPIRDAGGNITGLIGIFRDITERRVMIQKLRESEEKYRDLFEACPVSLWEEDFSAVKQFVDELREKGVSDFDAYFANHPTDVAKCAALVKVLNVNKATLNLYDAKSMDEIVGGLSDVLTEESNRAFVGEVLALAQGKKYYEAEFENRTLRGETKHCNVICAVVPGYEQSLVKVLISIVDLTHQKKLEENLRAARDQLDYVVSSNPAAINLAKPLPDGSDLMGIYMSKSSASVLGVEPEELLGESGAVLWASRVNPDDLREYRAKIPLLWKNGYQRFEYRFLHKDGSIRWIHEEDKVVRDQEGQVKNVIGYFVDITDQKRLEEELRAARDRLEYVIASNPAVLVLEKPLPDLSNTYSTFVSESATFVLGFEPKNFLGEAGAEFWKTRIPPDDMARYLAEMPSLWKDRHHAFEFRFLHSDGAYRWIREEMKLTHDAEGRILDVVGVCIDVTERKKLEEKLAKAERLAAIGETAAMVGHDLRNPLQGIAGASYNIRRNLRDEPDPSTKEMLTVIDNSVEYANGIVTSLLEYSREMQIQRAPTTAKSMINHALAGVELPKNITIEDATTDTPEILADEQKLRRVFTNLIVNAIEAMPEGGKLLISSINTQRDVSILVRDTGNGIPGEALQKLWTPLYTTKAKGMGLGLAICKRIMEAHGGSISVDSIVGKGTTFTLTLPIQNVQQEVKPL
jgi:PAS domain S-box-containing protein